MTPAEMAVMSVVLERIPINSDIARVPKEV
jgi:hypothetical protein